MAAARLSTILVLVRDVARGVKFYETLGCRAVGAVSEDEAQVSLGAPGAGDDDDADELSLVLRRSDNEAQLSSGYTPLLLFNVSQVDEKIVRLLELGASLDGPIERAPEGTTATMRAPDGLMISIHEPRTEPQMHGILQQVAKPGQKFKD